MSASNSTSPLDVTWYSFLPDGGVGAGGSTPPVTTEPSQPLPVIATSTTLFVIVASADGAFFPPRRRVIAPVNDSATTTFPGATAMPRGLSSPVATVSVAAPAGTPRLAGGMAAAVGSIGGGR